MLESLHVVAFTHRRLNIADVGSLIVSEVALESFLRAVKKALSLEEVFYIGTCNRTELVMVSEAKPKYQMDAEQVTRVVVSLANPSLVKAARQRIEQGAEHYSGDLAMEHLMKLSCSLESMVVGEKEILAQVRLAYGRCKDLGYCGDLLRLVMDRVVKAAKEVYTNTQISKNPVSIVSIAYRKLRSYKIPLDARICLIGAGDTNSLFSKYLVKHGYHKFTVINRSLDKAKKLADAVGGKSFALDNLPPFFNGFDVLLLCTSSPEPLVDERLYKYLLAGETSKKFIIDLGLPGDLSKDVAESHALHYVDMKYLQQVAKKNKEDRCKELSAALEIIKTNLETFRPLLQQRRMEVTMRALPLTVRTIREQAVNAVFAKDLQKMDNASREVLEKVLNYMEKKYISVPMVMAKEIMLKG